MKRATIPVLISIAIFPFLLSVDFFAVSQETQLGVAAFLQGNGKSNSEKNRNTTQGNNINKQEKDNHTDSILFSDDFNDNNFTRNPPWKSLISQSCAQSLPGIFVEKGVLKLIQRNAGKCGNNAQIVINLNIPVNESTKIRFDVNPVYSTVDYGAGWSNSEYPVIVSLYLLTADKETLVIRFCYNYRGGESMYGKDRIQIAFPQCHQAKWLRDEIFHIRKFFPEATTITRLEIASVGWDYEGYVDNIKIFGRNELEKTTKKVPLKIVDKDTLSPDEKAINMYLKRLMVVERMGQKKEIPGILFTIATKYAEMGYSDSAENYFIRTIKSNKKIHSTEPPAELPLKGLLNVYLAENNNLKALKVLDDLIKIYKERNETDGILFVKTQKAFICKEMGEDKMAQEYYNEVLLLCGPIEQTVIRAGTHKNLGDIHLKKYHYDSALTHYKTASELFEKEGDLNTVASCLFSIADVYFRLNQETNAVKNLKKSEILANMKDLGNLLSDIYLKYSEIYDKMGAKEKALKYYKLYSESRSVIFSQEKKKELDNMFAKYETDKKVKEIEVLTQEKHLQNLKIVFSFFVAGLVFILTIILYSRYRSKQKANQLLISQKLQLEQMNSILISKTELITQQKDEIEKRIGEKEIMFRELHHRVKNNLQIIYSMLSIQSRQIKDPEAIAVLQGNIHRIWAMSLIHHKLYKDENLTQINMQEYFSELIANILETSSFPNGSLKIIQDIENINLEADHAIPLGLITNELIVNALKHAFENIANPELRIILHRNIADGLTLTIKDNGIGLPDNFDIHSPGGFGIRLVNLLITQIHAKLEVINQDGTCFKLVLM